MQALRSGSYAVVGGAPELRTLALWAWPTRPAAGREQALLATGDALLGLDAEGRAFLRAGGTELISRTPLARECWVQIAIVLGGGRVALAVDGCVVAAASTTVPAAGTIHLAADLTAERPYDGRLEELTGFGDALGDDALAPAALATQTPDWQCDVRTARLVNAPTTAVTGRRWDDDTTDFRAARGEYAAVHFHSDDLEDAGWEPSLALTIPADLASGVYAFALAAGDLVDHVPFVVRPRRRPAHGARSACCCRR